MKVVLASKNPHKLVEISAILKPLDVELVLESDLGDAYMVSGTVFDPGRPERL